MDCMESIDLIDWTEGQSDKGTKRQRDKGTKGQWDKGTRDTGTMCMGYSV